METLNNSGFRESSLKSVFPYISHIYIPPAVGSSGRGFFAFAVVMYMVFPWTQQAVTSFTGRKIVSMIFPSGE